MLIEKMSCPNGCEKSTFVESKKPSHEQSANLLLEGNQNKNTATKVYTCKCCGVSFEILPKQDSKMVL